MSGQRGGLCAQVAELAEGPRLRHPIEHGLQLDLADGPGEPVDLEDDGVGLDKSAASGGGRGLPIHKRAAALGGTALIERVSERGGTRVTLRFPLRES